MTAADGSEWLAKRFEENRPHLRAVAYRMLGSPGDADDAVQESWLRLSRSGTGDVDNLEGWLTTVVARVCLDVLRSRKTRREDFLQDRPRDVAASGSPEDDALVADSVGLALLVVLETLKPAERVSFVLHDLFGVPFDEVAPIVGRTPAATRQLASRARRRVQGSEAGTDAGDAGRRREIVEAFLAASREGRFEALLALLDPDVVLRADAATVQMGAEKEVLGARAVAETFVGRAKAARPAMIDGDPGAVWSQGGVPRVAFRFLVVNEKIAELEMLSDPDELSKLELVLNA